MKLSIISQFNEEGFQQVAAKGLQALEICLNDQHDVDTFCGVVSMSNLQQYSKEYNVKISSIGRWGSNKIAEDGSIIEKELQHSYRLIDTAAMLNCPVFVCGVNYVKTLSYYENCTSAIQFLEKLVQHGKKRGVKIATYNCRWNNFIMNPMSWTMIHGHIKELGIKYDASHPHYDKESYEKEILDWGHRFYHVHAKGALTVNEKRVDDPPVGLDELKWPTILSLLNVKGYEGYVSIEPHSEHWQGEKGEFGIRYSIAYLQNMMMDERVTLTV